VETRPQKQRLDDLPAEVIADCRQISRAISKRNQSVRDEKILAARMRLSSGYYDSHHVLRVIASRLLTEGLL
jgi:hypothetical protein